MNDYMGAMPIGINESRQNVPARENIKEVTGNIASLGIELRCGLEQVAGTIGCQLPCENRAMSGAIEDDSLAGALARIRRDLEESAVVLTAIKAMLGM